MSRNRGRHEPALCNGCNTQEFPSRRYKCLQCVNFDLCGRCYDSGAAPPPHRSNHSMQLLLTAAEQELYFGGEPDDAWESFACPGCERVGFTKADLYDHIMSHNSGFLDATLCPVCVVSSAGATQIYMSGMGFRNHLAYEHLHLRDESDDESYSPEPVGRPPDATSPRAVSTARRSGFGGVGRGRRVLSDDYDPHVRSPPEHTAAHGDIRSFGRGARSYPADLLVQLRRQEAESTGFDEINRSEDELIRRTRDARSDTPPPASDYSFMSDGTMASVSTVSTDHAAAEVSLVSRVDDLLLDERALMPSLLKPDLLEEEKEKLDVERANRSLFLQQLLYSMSVKPKAEEDTQPKEPPPEAPREFRSAKAKRRAAAKARKAMQRTKEAVANVPKTKATSDDTAGAASSTSPPQCAGLVSDGDAKNLLSTTSSDAGAPKLAQDSVAADSGGGGDWSAQNGAIADMVAEWLSGNGDGM